MVSERISFAELRERLLRVFADAGASAEVALVLADNLASCERDGALSHGVFRLPGYLSSIRSGWADGRAAPVIDRVGEGFIRVDAKNGFAQPALAAASSEIDEAIARAGVAVVAIREAHHFGALWPDLEPFAERGLVGLTMVTGAASVIPRGASEAVLGTNPIAFATPVADAEATLPPLVMDFATSAMSHGDLQLAARAGEEVPLGTGVGHSGRDTADPQEILDRGGLLPFGGHKGAALSIMVEVLASALTGAAFSYRDDLILPPRREDGGTDRTGQLLIFIDPQRGRESSFASQVGELIAHLREVGLDRLPADRRYRNRTEAEKSGIPVTPAIAALPN